MVKIFIGLTQNFISLRDFHVWKFFGTNPLWRLRLRMPTFQKISKRGMGIYPVKLASLIALVIFQFLLLPSWLFAQQQVTANTAGVVYYAPQVVPPAMPVAPIILPAPSSNTNLPPSIQATTSPTAPVANAAPATINAVKTADNQASTSNANPAVASPNASAPATATQAATIIAPNIAPKSENNQDTKKTATATTRLQSPSSGGISELLFGEKIESLMFTDRENDAIDRAVSAMKNKEPILAADIDLLDDEKRVEVNKLKAEQSSRLTEEMRISEAERSYIYLGSVIYFSPKAWAVWINDNKITPETNKKDSELYLLSVTRESVRVLWRTSRLKILSKSVLAPDRNDSGDENNIVEEFTLKPNQTFVLGTKTIVEGRGAVTLLRQKQKERIDDIKKQRVGQ